MKKPNFSQRALAVSLLFVAIYLLCLGWSYLLTDPSLKILHEQLLALTFPGFVWLSWGSFAWGLVLSFAYGWVGTGVFVWLQGVCCESKGKGKSDCCK